MEAGDSYQLREPAVPYIAHFVGKKDDIGPENTYLWDVNLWVLIGYLDPIANIANIAIHYTKRNKIVTDS